MDIEWTCPHCGAKNTHNYLETVAPTCSGCLRLIYWSMVTEMEAKQTYEMQAEYDKKVAEEILVSAQRIKELEQQLARCLSVPRDLRETLALLEHQQWAYWAKAVKPEVSPERRERWQKRMMPYRKLSEDAKSRARKWADKVFITVRGALEQARREGYQNGWDDAMQGEDSILEVED